MRLKFLGAAKTVTGSRTLLSFKGKNILIDCGLFQGPREIRELNWQPFAEAEKIDAIILTHAHIDHSGYLPKIVNEGFKGPIHCSKPTADLCQVMLLDSAHLQEEDAYFAKRKRHSRHDPPLPLYTEKDALLALENFVSHDFDQWIELYEGFSFRLVRSGHILGSSFVQISFENGNGVQIITFSGDLGHDRQFVLRAPDQLTESDYIVLESTYGDRRHPKADPLSELEAVIQRTYNRGGTLVIPSFAVGRTQEVLYMVRHLEESGRIPKIPTFLDSPMASKATRIYLEHPFELNMKLVKGQIEAPLCSSCFQTVTSADDSMLLCMKDDEPMIIISAAGMLSGGRILHHLKTRLPKEKNTILFVGYQAEGTKGRLLQSGIPTIRLHHKDVDVEAEIATIQSLSAHADVNDLMNWIDGFQKRPKKIFLNHGELPALRALEYRIKNELEIPTAIPGVGDSFEL